MREQIVNAKEKDLFQENKVLSQKKRNSTNEEKHFYIDRKRIHLKRNVTKRKCKKEKKMISTKMFFASFSLLN